MVNACMRTVLFRVRGLQSALHYINLPIHTYSHPHAGKLQAVTAALGQTEARLPSTGTTRPSSEGKAGALISH